ncbi:MAG: hypothetical protein UY31_C0068G0003 [Candidatus Wolfebacteria bacterium GW2011_GWE1_48_7]|nr:MAG: hypothetical protein UX58_C0002G0063 [Candidatus Wolfebacteria bacterium GW2011_GWB2_46_69]KKU58889.1 MAG: hypothetical protein UX83_C0010G0011 [Candidatus Wolfebacteria bacterium GW2011_GWE2_47_12]KKU66146.1 MAG: hypothetical protein UX90_C0001G0205 [Candidatus Wolfebacteria bacterium GW2011_GWD2_47_17]KKU72898.1 MAG: hypothetical protein UX96_C0012G0011 [Candidatus Wolfebacteria bacterium GW2011_GWB1_47_243]KKU76594.1 MAG: hypothetical protein UY00_C0007G0007 [Candidatus Wolfebacteria
MVMFGTLVLIAIAIGGYGASQAFRRGTTAPEISVPAPQAQAMVVVLDSQNGSGQMGTATLTATNGKTQVVLKLTGGPEGVVQPAHIHTGTCASIGQVVYPLTFPVDGESTTILDVPMTKLLGGLPLAINVHKSPQEAGIYYACGDIAR